MGSSHSVRILMSINLHCVRRLLFGRRQLEALRAEVEKLKEDYAIYIVGSGRINVAGITPGNVDRLCEAIASVL